MEIRIADVEHGFCALIFADNGNLMMIDCGHNAETSFRPSLYLFGKKHQTVSRLIISNYDEDHVSDLPQLRLVLDISVLHHNESLSPEQLLHLKGGRRGIGPGIGALLEMMDRYTADVTSPPDLAGVEFAMFKNSYPTHTNTNDLSLVTFVDYGDLHVVFPGDLEEAGWLALLDLEGFKQSLGKVNVFVASHHGRESGYCSEVFEYCEPKIVIISDEAKQYDTQDTAYGQHATGVTTKGESRRVLSTRKDGMITLSQEPGGGASVVAANWT